MESKWDWAAYANTLLNIIVILVSGFFRLIR